MDDDDLRRGKPTNHKVFGEAMAILAGDAMTTLAFEILARDAAPEVAAGLVRELASAAGPAGMIGGQVMDMDSQNAALSLEQLTQLHRMKTGALLTSACRMGAIAAGADKPALRSIGEFGRHIGVAFQIVDDLLDVTATPEQMGKQTGKDAGRGKNTFPALIGVDESVAEAKRHLDAAIRAIAGFGPAGASLTLLARFIGERSA